MLLKFTYSEDVAAVVGLLQLGRRAGGLSGASFGPVGVAHEENGEGQAGLRRCWSYLGPMMAVLMRAGGEAAEAGGKRSTSKKFKN